MLVSHYSCRQETEQFLHTAIYLVSSFNCLTLDGKIGNYLRRKMECRRRWLLCIPRQRKGLEWRSSLWWEIRENWRNISSHELGFPLLRVHADLEYGLLEKDPWRVEHIWRHGKQLHVLARLAIHCPRANCNLFLRPHFQIKLARTLMATTPFGHGLFFDRLRCQCHT